MIATYTGGANGIYSLNSGARNFNNGTFSCAINFGTDAISGARSPSRPMGSRSPAAPRYRQRHLLREFFGITPRPGQVGQPAGGHGPNAAAVGEWNVITNERTSNGSPASSTAR